MALGVAESDNKAESNVRRYREEIHDHQCVGKSPNKSHKPRHHSSLTAARRDARARLMSSVVTLCLYVCLSVRHVRRLYQND